MTRRARETTTGRRRGALAVAATLVGLLLAFPAGAPAVEGARAPAPGAASAPETENRYIVVLKDRVERPGAVAAAQHRRYGVERTATYRSALNGYAARVSPREVAELRDDDRVAYVERDAVIRVAETVQEDPPWGLDRIDERRLPLNGEFAYDRKGRDVTAYVIDSGIRTTHSEFGDRADSDRDLVDPVNQGRRHTGGRDCNGHGTHVAGTVGGKTFGVAKKATLVGVRVVDCNGFGLNSEVIAGVDWVTSDHRGDEPAVANMSLGGPHSNALDDAVRNSIDDGISYAVAAGNGNFLGVEQDACRFSPAGVGPALTVGATDRSDTKAFFSNFGDCLDLFAPGVEITSAWRTSDSARVTISGTSMASPHVAGVAALYLDGHEDASPTKVRRTIRRDATEDVVADSRTARADLLFTRW